MITDGWLENSAQSEFCHSFLSDYKNYKLQLKTPQFEVPLTLQ